MPTGQPCQILSQLLLQWIDKKSGVWQTVQFDAVTTETHESLMTITEHPVEAGADVVDHARPKPKQISVEGYVTNKPIWSNPGVSKLAEFASNPLTLPKYPKGTRPKRRQLFIPTMPPLFNVTSLVKAGVGAIMGAIFGNETWVTLAAEHEVKTDGLRVYVLAAKGDFTDRAVAVHKLLLAAQDERALVTVTTRMGQIENMLIAKVGVPRTAETGNGATFQDDLTQVRLVASMTTSAPKAAEKRGTPPKIVGSQAPVVLPDVAPETKAQLTGLIYGVSKGATAP